MVKIYVQSCRLHKQSQEIPTGMLKKVAILFFIFLVLMLGIFFPHPLASIFYWRRQMAESQYLSVLSSKMKK